MRGRRVVIIGAVLMGGVALLATVATVNDYRRHAAAERALPGANAFLRSSPAYATVQVDVSNYKGGGLWFTGNLPTQGDCDRLEGELKKRFDTTEFELMFSVLSRNE